MHCANETIIIVSLVLYQNMVRIFVGHNPQNIIFNLKCIVKYTDVGIKPIHESKHINKKYSSYSVMLVQDKS